MTARERLSNQTLLPFTGIQLLRPIALLAAIQPAFSSSPSLDECFSVHGLRPQKRRGGGRKVANILLAYQRASRSITRWRTPRNAFAHLSPGRPRPPKSSGSSTLPFEGAKPRGSLRSRLVAACYPGRSSQSMRSSPRGSFARLRLAQLANSQKRAANEILPGLPCLTGLCFFFPKRRSRYENALPALLRRVKEPHLWRSTSSPVTNGSRSVLGLVPLLACLAAVGLFFFFNSGVRGSGESAHTHTQTQIPDPGIPWNLAITAHSRRPQREHSY